MREVGIIGFIVKSEVDWSQAPSSSQNTRNTDPFKPRTDESLDLCHPFTACTVSATVAFIHIRRRRKWSLLVKIEGDPLNTQEEEVVVTRENRRGFAQHRTRATKGGDQEQAVFPRNAITETEEEEAVFTRERRIRQMRIRRNSHPNNF